MYWKIKNLASRILAAATDGKKLHSLERSLMRGRQWKAIAKSVWTLGFDFEGLEKHCPRAGKRVLEFGSGCNVIAVRWASEAGTRRIFAFLDDLTSITEVVHNAVAPARALDLARVGNSPRRIVSGSFLSRSC